MNRPHRLNRGPVVHSVVAAAVADPSRLQAWTVNPSGLTQLDVDPAELDLEAVADFAGLAEKIRHNGCRHQLRMTFQLLNQSGLEIQLFRDYAPHSLRRRQRGLKSPLQRVDGLAEFIGRWSRGDPLRSLIRDVLLHEQALMLMHAADTDRPQRCSRARPMRQPVPAPNGVLVVRTLTCDPRQVQQVLQTPPADLADIRRGRWTFVYHKTIEQLRMLEVEQAVGHLLTVVDGRRSVDRMSEQLFGNSSETPALMPLLDQLVAIGLLRWLDNESPSRCT
ncbi:MAG TPA: hypothetical protein VMB04_12040 [Mycobacterium sp.]|nr:hypothetical protein [Mycobacterium sp.]